MRFALIVILMTLPFYGKAQEYKKLRLAIGTGYGNVHSDYTSDNNTGNTLIFLEPSFRLSDRSSLGVRLEAVGPFIGGGKSVASYGLNGQYYLVRYSGENYR